MDGWMGWMDGVDGWMDEMDGWDGNRWDGWMDWLHGWMGEMDGWNGWMEWMDGWDGWMGETISNPTSTASSPHGLSIPSPTSIPSRYHHNPME